MLLKWILAAALAFVVARWLFRDSLKAFLGRLDRRLNRAVNLTLIALLIVYSLRLILLWFGIVM